MSKLNNVTIKDVAKEANVSIATVSYVINNMNKVKETTRERVLDAIKKLNYEPNIIAQSLVKKENKSIAILIPLKDSNKRSILTENPFFQEFISGVEYSCSEHGFNTTIIGIDNKEKYGRLIQNGSLSGIIVLGYIGESNYNLLSSLSVPVVLIDQQRTAPNFINITSDDEKGAFLATEYLISKGHKNIGLVTGHIWESIIYKYRFEGYRSALNKYGIDFNSNNIFECDVNYDDGIQIAESVKNKLNELTAIFCTSDIVALGLIKGLHKYKINVPQDLSIIGFDNIKHSKYFIPELTTISQNIFERGELAAEVIFKNELPTDSQSIQNIIIPNSLIERESVSEMLNCILK